MKDSWSTTILCNRVGESHKHYSNEIKYRQNNYILYESVYVIILQAKQDKVNLRICLDSN